MSENKSGYRYGPSKLVRFELETDSSASCDPFTFIERHLKPALAAAGIDLSIGRRPLPEMLEEISVLVRVKKELL